MSKPPPPHKAEGISLPALEEAILTLLAQRPGRSICPSEAARLLASQSHARATAPGDWRAWMEPVRAAAQHLVKRGRIRVTQRGRPADTSARGPIRLSLR